MCALIVTKATCLPKCLTRLCDKKAIAAKRDEARQAAKEAYEQAMKDIQAEEDADPEMQAIRDLIEKAEADLKAADKVFQNFGKEPDAEEETPEAAE